MWNLSIVQFNNQSAHNIQYIHASVYVLFTFTCTCTPGLGEETYKLRIFICATLLR